MMKHKDHFRPLCSSLWQLRQGAELFVQLCINFKQIENVSSANLSINKIANTTGKNAKNVSSEQILYDHLSIARDVDTPELLKEMTTKRGLIEESLNKRSTIMESTAMELPGLTAQTQQVHFMNNFSHLSKYCRLQCKLHATKLNIAGSEESGRVFTSLSMLVIIC